LLMNADMYVTTPQTNEQNDAAEAWMMEQGTISNSQILTEKEREIENRINRIENFLSSSYDE